MSARVPVNVNHELPLQLAEPFVAVGRLVLGNVAVVSAEFPGIVRAARFVAAHQGLQSLSTEH